MSSLITQLAYERIDRTRLIVTYAVGLTLGLVLAAAALAAMGAFSIP